MDIVRSAVSGTRRGRIRLIAGVMALAFVAAACGGTTDSSGTTATTGATGTTTANTGGPSGPQVLVVGAIEDQWVNAAEGDKKRRPNYPLNADVCETLVQLTADFAVAPMVTTGEYIGDNTYRFTLLDGVTFSDGTPVTVQDLKYSADYVTLEPPIGVGAGRLEQESTTIIDERTIQVVSPVPNLRLLEQINHPSLVVLKEGSDPLNDVENIVCTGPFMVESYAPEQELVVVRNPNFWGEAPALDRITFRFYPDATTRALALQNNEVDMIMDVPLSILDSVASQPGVKIVRAPVGNNTMFYIARRTSEGVPRILNDALVRRAVAAAIDRDAYVEGVLAGNAESIPHIAPPSVLGQFAGMVEGVPYDPTEAGRLLDEAGWTRSGDGPRTKDGQTLTVKIIYDRVELTTAEFVQAELRKVGFDAQVAQLDSGAYREALNTGDYDIDISLPNQNDGNPAFLLALRWHTKATGANAQIISPGPETRFEEIIDATLVEPDFTELQRLAAEGMKELLDVEVGGVNLAGGYRVYALKDKVMGFEPHPSSTNQRWRTVFIQG